MPVLRPCPRHSRAVWLASCPYCTAWHPSRQLAREPGRPRLDRISPPTGTTRPRRGE